MLVFASSLVAIVNSWKRHWRQIFLKRFVLPNPPCAWEMRNFPSSLFHFIRNFAISPAVANGKIPLLPGGDGFPACRAVHHMALLVGFYQKL